MFIPLKTRKYVYMLPAMYKIQTFYKLPKSFEKYEIS